MKKEALRIKLMEMITEEVVKYAGNITSLKLYDASSLACKIARESSNEEVFEVFNNFYQESFDTFMEDSPMKKLKFKNLGITSLFRIDTKDRLYGRAYYYDDYINASEEEKKQMLYEEFLYIQNTDEIDFEEMEKYDIKTLIKEMKEYVKSFNDIIRAYKEIEDFKKNQIEYFKEYIEDCGYDFEISEEV